MQQGILFFLIAFFLSLSCSAAQTEDASEPRTSREKAVAQARRGECQKALEILGSLRKEYPDDQAVLHDYLVVLAWAGRYADAAALSGALRPEQVPAYVARQAAAALRKAGKLVQAQHWYDAAAGRFPDDQDIAIGRALTLADRGQASRGLDALRAYARTHPEADSKHLSDAKAYIRNRLEPPKPFVPPSRPMTGYRGEQDEAVTAARLGKLADALARLRSLHQHHPDDQFLLSDYLTVLQWNRENESVLTLAGRLRLASAPPYAVEAVARAMLAVRGPYDAETFMETAVEAQCRNPEMLISAARIAGGSGDPYKAARYLDEAERSRAPGLGARIEAARRENGDEQIKAMDALNEVERTLARLPDNQDALRIKARALSAGGAHQEARAVVDGRLSSAGRTSGLPLEHAQDIRRAASLESAAWGEQSAIPRYLEERERHLEAALDALDELAASPQCAVSEQCRIRTRMDRMQPLYALGRDREVVAEYENVMAKSPPLSPAAQLAAAGARMRLHEPRLAAEIYSNVISRRDEYHPHLSPDDLFTAESGLFWAYLEDERLSAALDQAHALYDRAIRPTGGQPPFADTDWKKSAAAAILGYAYLYTGCLDKAEQHFTTLARSAPAMLDAQSGLAGTYSMRGLPRTALDTLARARVFSPDDINLAVRTADALMDIQNWRNAKEILDSLEPYSLHSQAVRQLQRRWETHSLFELRVDGAWAKNFAAKNPGTTDRSQTPSLEGRLYSPPIAYDWRMYAGFAMAESDFAEGHARQGLTLAGVEYRGTWLTASLEARNDHVKTDKLGLGLYGSVTPDDHWSFPFTLEKDSRETPLRARNADVTADNVRLGVAYRWNESRRLDGSIGGMSFSDGNRRLSMEGSFTQRLWAWQTHYLDGTAGIYASGNSKDADRPYFNPKADMDVGGTLTYGALLWRDYDTSLSHALSLGAGGYAQLDHGAGPVWSVAYSQSLDWTDRFAVTCGAGVSRRIYDGNPENSLNTFFSLVWKF